jgi:hypothetical protein
MAFNQVIVEGDLAMEPQMKQDRVEFFLAYERGLDGKPRALFSVEVWRDYTELRAELRRAKGGDRLLVLGHLRGHPWETKIHAVVIKRLKKSFPYSSGDGDESLITGEDRAF